MYQDCLLKYLEEENLSEFEKLLKDKDKDNINAFHVHGETLLAEASKKGLTEFVEALLNSGADPNIVCSIHFGKAAIHFAAEEGHIDVIKCLVNHPSTNINAIDRQGNTALHLVASNFTVEGKNAEACFSYLASLPDTNIRHRNAKCLSAISIAFEKCSGKCSVDIWQVVLRRSDIRPEDRQLILDKYPDLKEGIPENIEPIYTYDDAYTDLRNEAFETFKRDFKAEFVDETELIEATFLELACIKGRLDIVQLLLDLGADVNKTGTHENGPPVHLACYFGQYETLVRLLKTNKVNIWSVNEKSLLHSVLEGLIGFEGSTDGHRKCFDYLLEQKLPDIPINYPDRYGNTALHYAAELEDVHYAKALVQHGAYIGHLNECGFSPLDYISPYALEEILDDCVECTERGDGSYDLKFNFSMLNPTESCDMAGQTWDFETGGRLQVNLPEMSPLYFISRSKKLGYLLKHPVLLAFLHRKWTRICLMFYINMIYYIIFVIFLTLNIFSETSSDGNYNGNWNEEWVILYVLWVILVVRELMQFYLLPRKLHYFFNLENILEVTIIVFTSLILNGYYYTLLAGVTPLLAWMEVILQFGCLNKMAVYNEMIKRVTLNCMNFLIWNLPLIIAFSFSFYKLYHTKNPSEGNGGTSYINNTSGNSCCQDDKVDFYSSLHLSLLKTVVMMIGEFDASSMSLDNGSYLVFLFFVFMMVMVMMNLLNAVAVSEIQAIKKNDELVASICRVKLVHLYESLVFGGSFNNPRMSQLAGGSPSLRKWILRQAICLFPDSLRGQNQNEQSVVLKKVPSFINLYIERSDRDEGCRPFTCCKIGKLRIGLDIDREVLIAAKNIADQRQKHSRHKSSQIVD